MIFSRYVAQGKGILQPHHLVCELAEVIKNDEAMEKLSDSPFTTILESVQVDSHSVVSNWICTHSRKKGNERENTKRLGNVPMYTL